MRNRCVSCTGLTVLAVLLLLTLVPAAAQTAKASGKAYNVPRLPDGHPDLQGVYDLATITPMQRAAGSNLVLTKEEALKLETARAGQREPEITHLI